MLLAAAMGTGASLGCTSAPTFQCSDDASCGPSGTCEANNFCSFPDTTCPSGRRYGDFSEEYGQRCVDPDAETEPTSTSTSSGGTTDASPVTTGLSLSDASDSGSTDGGSVDTGTTTSGEASETTSDDERTIGPLQIQTNLDDGCIYLNGENDATWLPSGEQNSLGFLGEYPLGSPYYGYFRFELPEALPAGTAVPTATLTLDGHATYQWNPEAYALAIYVEISGDAEPVDGSDRFPSEGQTELSEESVRWPARGGLTWDVQDTNTSTNVGPLLEALIAQMGGLDAGAHVQFWISKAELGQDAEVGYVDFTADPERASTLTLTINRK